MMILMESSVMAVTMASISPSGREFLRQISVYRRAFLSLVFSASQRRRNSSLRISSILVFQGDDIRERASSEVGQGGQTGPRRGQLGARAWALSGPMVAHPSLSFWLRPSSGKIGTSGIFVDFIDLPHNGVLIATFPAEFQLRQQTPSKSSNMQKQVK